LTENEEESLFRSGEGALCGEHGFLSSSNDLDLSWSLCKEIETIEESANVATTEGRSAGLDDATGLHYRNTVAVSTPAMR